MSKLRQTSAGNSVDIASCDTFDFMANVIGLPILHPGGLRATAEMAGAVAVHDGSRILDVACGKGTTACHLAENFGCSVTGVDIDDRLVAQARQLAARKGLAGKAVFQKADAEALPFAAGAFDIILFQAVLIMLAHPRQALQEAIRILKPGGYLGVLELTWKRQPPAAFFADAGGICTFFQNVKTFPAWKELVFGDGISEKTSRLYDMACPCTLRELGWMKALGIFCKRVFHSDIRKRMKELDSFIDKNSEFFGYGIYIGQKPTGA